MTQAKLFDTDGNQNTESLLLALRSLQLPVVPESEPDVLDSLLERAEQKTLAPNDFAILIETEAEAWAKTGDAGKNLRDAVDGALKYVPPILAPLKANTYFNLHKRLKAGTSDAAGLTHKVAVRLLSRASLIGHLLQEEKFSCSQIARLLKATEHSLDVPYNAVVVVARGLELLPQLDQYYAVDHLQSEDAKLALTLYPDSDVKESSIIASEAIEKWMPDSNVRLQLELLSGGSGDETEPTWPYLQILHWCLTPIEFYDHPASYLYEFAPRGRVADGIFLRYPAATGNPVLNNAKAVETLNATWARNRGSDDAHALVALLDSLESLPFVPRRQVARVLRAWLFRIIELKSITITPIDQVEDKDFVLKFVSHVCRWQTNTQGVIEQRVVDYLSFLAFQGEGWRVRGIKDGVNASNLSRKKLGDLEFTNVDNRAAIAIEAHGGHLSYTYVANHLRSLSRSIEQRLEDSWLDLDDAEAWSIRILFVAHSREESNLPVYETLHGVEVEYDYIDYSQLLSMAINRSTEKQQLECFGEFVTEVLNRETVRESARDKFRKIRLSLTRVD